MQFNLLDTNKKLCNLKTEELITSTVKKIKDVLPRLQTIDVKRPPNTYSYLTLDNIRADRILKELKSTYKSKDLIGSTINKRDVNVNNGEISDSLFPMYSFGYTYLGQRRSRLSVMDNLDFNITEILELRLSNLIPGIIYLINNKYFDENVFSSQYTTLEYEDFMELLQCLVSKTLTNNEKERLSNYLHKDKVISHFIYSKCIIKFKSNNYFYHPSFVGWYFDNTVIYIKDYLDILMAYCKNIFYPILILEINQIQRYVNTKPLLKIYVRSVQDYRLIIEKDLGTPLETEVEFLNDTVLKPKEIVINNYPQAAEKLGDKFDISEYIKNLEDKCGKDVYNNFLGEVGSVRKI